MTEEETIRVLAVRQPWASLIVEGLKTIEVRTRFIKTSYPNAERVAIYASKKVPTIHERVGCFSTLGRWMQFEEMNAADKEKFNRLNLIGYNSSNLGVIIGTVEISNCRNIGELTTHDKETIYRKSYAPAAMIKDSSYIWELKNPAKFPEPIPLDKWPSGGPWAKVPKSMLPGV